MPRKSKKQIEAEKETTPLFPIALTYTTSEGVEKEFHIKDRLTISEIAAFVETCSNSIVNNEHGYQPYLRDMMFNQSILIFFTDIEISGDADIQYKEFTETNLVEVVRDKISELNFGHLAMIEDYLDEAIEFKKQKLIAETSSISDGVIIAFTELLNALKEKVESIDMNSLVSSDSYENIAQLAQKLKGMDEKNIIDTIVNGSKEDVSDEVVTDNVIPIK